MHPSAAICKLVTPPIGEPISLAEAKEHLRVDGSDEDSLITMCIQSARERIEKDIRRSMMRQQWMTFISNFSAGTPVELPKGPLIGDGEFTMGYRKTDGDWELWETFDTQPHREPPLLWIEGSPADIAAPRNPLDAVWRATYWTGYSDDPKDVPGPLRHAILFLTAHLFEQREIAVAGSEVKEVPKSLDWLLNSYRVPWEGAIA